MIKIDINKYKKASSLIITFILITILSGCSEIKDYTFLNLVPESTLKSLDTKNVDEILKSVESLLKKQVKDLNAQEAILAKAYYEHKNDIDMTIKCSERALLLCTDQNISQEVTLQLAQIYLDKANFEKAEKYAKEYQELYPGNTNVKKALYIDIQANYLSILDPNRDQKKTEKTLNLSKNFLEKYKEEDNYFKAVSQIIDTCYDKLLDSEISVIKTYLNSYDYYKNFSSLNAAQRRLAYVKTKLLPFSKNQDKEKNINNLELAMNKEFKNFNFKYEQEVKS